MRESKKSLRVLIGGFVVGAMLACAATLLSPGYETSDVSTRHDELLPSIAADDDLTGSGTVQPAQPAAAMRTRIGEAYAKLPLAFEVNRGQVDPEVKFLSRGHGYTLFLTSTEAVMSLRRPSAEAKAGRTRFSDLDRAFDETAVVRMKFLDANMNSAVTGTETLQGQSNYFIGDDPAAWQTGVENYSGVRYEAVYPGVDLVFHGSGQHQLEYDFVIAPGADATVMRLGFEGVSRLKLTDAGDLELRTSVGDVVQRAPFAYQDIDGVRYQVAARYEVKSKDEIGFRVGEYDQDRPLIIDPVLAYSTYLGGSSFDDAVDVAVDSAGSAYVTGNTCSTNFPIRNAMQTSLPANTCNIFVAKFSPSGDSLVYSTYLGGSAGAGANGIAIDAAGSAYVTGETCSTNFPTVNPAQPAMGGGTGCDGFVAKLSPAGNSLQYSTYLGGTCGDAGADIAVDSAGRAYVTGETGGRKPTGLNCAAANFPTLNAFQSVHGGLKDGFLTKLTTTGSAFVYSTYIGGSQDDSALGVAIDNAGNAYVTGSSLSANFPTVNALQASKDFGDDVFVTKFSPAGNTLVYSTFLGGGCSDVGWDIALDTAGSAYVTGQTCSANFPTVNPLQGVYAGFTDAFVAKLSPAGDALTYSTYLGGNSFDLGWAIAVDGAGNAHVAGQTISTTFPVVNAVQAAKGFGYDGFVSRLAPAGNALTYSTYLGGTDSTFTNHEDGAFGIAVDSVGDAYVVGRTYATNFPTANALQPAKAGESDGFLAKLVHNANQPQSQTITFTTITGRSYGDPDFTLSATASSGLAITFTASGSCTVIGNTVHLTGAGSCTITATQSGDPNYEPAPPIEQTFEIAKADYSIVWNAPAAITYGTALDATQLNAIVSGVPNGAPIGTVIYSPSAGTVLPAGTQSLMILIGETANYNAVIVSVPLTVNKALLNVAAENQAKQYSDPLPVFTYNITGFVNGDTIAIVNGAASATTTATQFSGPGDYPIDLATGTLSANNYNFNTTGATLTVEQEDARANFTGSLFVSTTCSTCSTATVTLAALIKDITAVAGDPAYDPDAGDIRNAIVTFINRDTNTSIATVPVNLVSAGDTTVGTATFSWNVNIGSSDSADFTIGIVVGNYYVSDLSDDDVVVMVSKPLGTGFVTGGGYLVLSNSVGQFEGGHGSKMNFGFNVKNVKKNLQGRLNLIVRSGGRVYQFKGTVMNSLGVNISNPNAKTAVFTGKAAITDNTSPQNPISLGGNNNFRVELTDRGEPGNADSIGITIWDGNGLLLFSSNWNGARTIEQVLGGGNLVIH